MVTEQDFASAFIREFAASAAGRDSTRQAWSMFCQALFASAEFRYLD
jgi:hypothetical protein